MPADLTDFSCSQVDRSQIFAHQCGEICTGCVDASGGVTSLNVTNALQTAVATGSYRGDAVPLVASGGRESEGFVTGSHDFDNVGFVRDCDTGDSIYEDTTGREVYGRLVENAGVWTVEFYYLDDTGTEVSYSMDNDNVNICLPYIFEFGDWTFKKESAFADHSSSTGGGCPREECQVVSSINQVITLAGTPLNPNHQVFINGVHVNPNAYAVSGSSHQTVTFNPANLGYDVLAGFCVCVQYCV